MGRVYPLLEDVDDPVGDLELIEHVRQLEAWRAHQDEMSAHMRMAQRYAELLRAG